MALCEEFIENRPAACSKDFSYECEGCPEYVEEIDAAAERCGALAGCFGFYAHRSYRVEKCKRFNWKSRVGT